MTELVTLEVLLARGLDYDGHYGKRDLASHYTMALIALDAMGADDRALHRFSRAYEKRLRPLPPPKRAIDDATWLTGAGTYADYPAYFAWFADAIAASSGEAVVNRYLPALARAPGAGGFHGLIRVGYGLESGHDGELAAGLAYWVDTLMRLEDSPYAGETSADPSSLLERLRCSALGGTADDDGLIASVLARAAARPGFAPVRNWLRPDAATVRALAVCAAHIYLAAPDILTLHLVTSAHALRVVAAALADAGPLIQGYWQCFAAAYVALGTPAANSAPPSAEHRGDGARAAWQPLLRATHDSVDDHAIKLVHSCWQHWNAYGDPVFHAVAQRAVIHSRD